MKCALITGITGQDGSYLAEFLLHQGYEVHGIVRRVAAEFEQSRLWRVRHLVSDLRLHPATLESYPSLCKVIDKIQPHECYHLAAQSYVKYSFEDEFSTFNSNINGTHNLLAALLQYAPSCRFYFAGSSEMFGLAETMPQNEATPFHPRSPYAISKVTGYHLARYYREAYGLCASVGILFNHESPRRGAEFVTRKITLSVAQIKHGQRKKLTLGNLEARRDWGYAPEYVKGMWLMVQQSRPSDFVLATGQSHSVEDFARTAFTQVGLNYRDHVETDPELLRPAEVANLVGDASRAQRELGWQPQTSFEELVHLMVEEDLKRVGELKG
jgi:GDPmannose 4,6-dehydratase